MEWARQALAIDPLNPRATEFLTGLCWFVGDVPGVIAEQRRRASILGLSGERLAALEQRLGELQDAFAQRGRDGASRWLLESLPPAADSRHSRQRAVLHAALGEQDAAFDHLERALMLRDPHLVYLAVHGVWDSLRADRRMVEQLRRLRLPVPA